MCGRYVVAYDPETLVSGFSVLRVPPFPKRWNVAPQAPVPVLNETRSDSLFDKPSFRQAVRRRRCLLPASGFCEWQATPSGKQPWFVSARDGSLLAMAGLFEAWRASPDAESPDANTLMAPIHDRMPVLIPPEHGARWLARDVQDPDAIAALLAPPPSEALQAWPVARTVSSSASEGEALVQPIAAAPDPAG